jgi:hypothetical protein
VSNQQVIANMANELFFRRVAMLEALNRYYAVQAINYFLSVQPPGIDIPGKFWDNKTAQAATRMFANSFREGNDYGWFISHGVDYGVYLELANDRKHQALWPIIKRFSSRYFADVKKIFGGG